MELNLSSEIYYKTSRSSGAGGQHVNKVETAVTAIWKPAESQYLDAEQKLMVAEKLANRIDKEGLLAVRSSTHRTQLANKEEALMKLQLLVINALVKKKARIASRPSKAQKEQRLESKKRLSDKKASRQRKDW